MPNYDAVVVGSGPNGLAAAITLAKAGLSVVIYEAKEEIGGGVRSAEVTLPGFIHDLCSTIYPFSNSPFFSTIPLQQFGVEWIYPPLALAHPFDDQEAATIDEAKLAFDFAKSWKNLQNDILAPLQIPKFPILAAKFAYYGLGSAERLCRKLKNENEKALYAGLAAHSLLPLNKKPSAAFALVLATLAHVNGWPIVKGGAKNLSQALGAYFTSLGGQIITGNEIKTLPKAKALFCDLGPKALLELSEGLFPKWYQKKLQNYRYGPGVFKIDWALKGPIPWKDKKCKEAATIHLGGSEKEIAQSEDETINQGKHSEKPFVILAQASLFDPSRVPRGSQLAWGYCHVPSFSDIDMTEKIENQVERFAPGFKNLILAKSTKTAKQMQEYNPNYVGGDINGGIQDLAQLFCRPKVIHPYKTPLEGVYLCSSSTPPGGGVHGMCGFLAAKSYLMKL